MNDKTNTAVFMIERQLSSKNKNIKKGGGVIGGDCNEWKFLFI